MPGFSSKRRVYRKILKTEQLKPKGKTSLANKERILPVPSFDGNPEVLMGESTGQSEIQIASTLNCGFIEPLVVPRSRKLCNWKPNVSTVFEDSAKSDPKKGDPRRPCRLIRSIQNYLTAWFTPNGSHV
jgi:hypothetical protein